MIPEENSSGGFFPGLHLLIHLHEIVFQFIHLFDFDVAVVFISVVFSPFHAPPLLFPVVINHHFMFFRLWIMKLMLCRAAEQLGKEIKIAWCVSGGF